MSKIESPKCIKHPAEKVVGVCCSCLKERLTFLITSIDVISPPPPTPSSAFEDHPSVDEAGTSSTSPKDSCSDDEEEAHDDTRPHQLLLPITDRHSSGLGGKLHASSLVTEGHGSDASLPVVRLITDSNLPSCCSITDGHGHDPSCSSFANDRRQGDYLPATLNNGGHGHGHGDRVLATSDDPSHGRDDHLPASSAADGCLGGSLPVCSSAAGGHHQGLLPAIENLPSSVKGQLRLWRSKSVSERRFGGNSEIEVAGFAHGYSNSCRKVTLRTLFELEDCGEGADGRKGGTMPMADGRGALLPLMKDRSRRWCGCVTGADGGSVCGCPGRKKHSFVLKALLGKGSTKDAKHLEKQQQEEKENQEQGRQEEDEKVEVPASRHRHVACCEWPELATWKVDARSELHYNLAARAFAAAMSNAPASPPVARQRWKSARSYSSATSSLHPSYATSTSLPATPLSAGPPPPATHRRATSTTSPRPLNQSVSATSTTLPGHFTQPVRAASSSSAATSTSGPVCTLPLDRTSSSSRAACNRCHVTGLISPSTRTLSKRWGPPHQPPSRSVNKISPATLDQSGLLWFYLTPHNRSGRQGRSRLLPTGSSRRLTRSNSSSRAFKTLFLYK